MVKKLQALKAKKGFTLVELIVVIAIIGVLAAILVPTMMGMVTKSRVTSADQTAKGLLDTVTQWIADLEANGGTFPDNGGASTILITGNTKTATGITVAVTGYNGGDYKRKGVDAKPYLVDSIVENYTFNSNIQARVTLLGRKVIGCVYVDNDSSPLINISVQQYQDGVKKWDNKNNEGVLNGQIYGTSPKLSHSDSST